VVIRVLELRHHLLADSCSFRELRLREASVVSRPTQEQLDGQLGGNLHPEDLAPGAPRRWARRNSPQCQVCFKPTCQGICRLDLNVPIGACFCLATRAVRERSQDRLSLLLDGRWISHDCPPT